MCLGVAFPGDEMSEGQGDSRPQRVRFLAKKDEAAYGICHFGGRRSWKFISGAAVSCLGVLFPGEEMSERQGDSRPQRARFLAKKDEAAYGICHFGGRRSWKSISGAAVFAPRGRVSWRGNVRRTRRFSAATGPIFGKKRRNRLRDLPFRWT